MFASLTYPARSTVAVHALAVVAYAVLAVAFAAPPAPAIMTAGCLVVVSSFGVVQARNHGRQRTQLALLSQTDSLTGLLNPAAFGEHLGAALAASAREAIPVSVVALEVDRSRRSTTGRATPPATRRCGSWRTPSARVCGGVTCAGAWAATSSCSPSWASTARRPRP